MRQLVAHGSYACIANCRTKSQDIARNICNFKRNFKISLIYSKISQWTLNDVPPNPGREALRQVQSAQCCRGAAFKGMMGEETWSIHMYSPQYDATAWHRAQYNEWFTNNIFEHKATANYVNSFVRKSCWHKNQTRTVAHGNRQVLPHCLWKFTASSFVALHSTFCK
jgi:hypothetical protein